MPVTTTQRPDLDDAFGVFTSTPEGCALRYFEPRALHSLGFAQACAAPLYAASLPTAGYSKSTIRVQTIPPFTPITWRVM